MVGINDSRRVDDIYFFIHVMQPDQVFIMIILRGVSVFADGAPEHNMRQGIACRFHLVSAVYKMVRMLCRINRIKHNGKIPAGRVFHSRGNIKTANGQTVLLVFHGAGADCNIGKKIVHISPVFRVKHFIGRGQAAFCNGTQMHFADSNQSLHHIRFFFRIRLGSDSFVSFARGSWLVGVDARNDNQLVPDIFLYFCKPVYIVADRVFVVCRTRPDNYQKTGIFSGNDIRNH